jgi:ribosomal protein L11 methyltransferase
VTRLIPALDLRFPPLVLRPNLPDLVSLALDDLAPAAIHETGAEDRPTWRVFLTDAKQIGKAAARLSAEFGEFGLDVTLASIEEVDWAARSQARLTRINVGRVTVAPPWDAAPPGGGVLVIIQPSTGFGTGHHQTTRLCLQMLQRAGVAGRRLLDLGTGSGVLALAAWRLGAASVEAIDYDENAIVNAHENLLLNGVDSQIAVRFADLRTATIEPADVVTANLTGGLLVSEAERIRGLVKPGGQLILAGFVVTETPDVIAAYAPPFEVAHTSSEDEWQAVRLRPQSV